MSLTNLTADLDIIQALDKRPNVFGNPPLSYDQLQAKFDEAANTIKTYLNGTLIPEIEAQKGDAADVAALQTEVIALKAVNRLVYCAQDVPKTALPADIITVGKNWFYPKPAVGDTVLGKNMYVARVTTISGNDATLTGIGTVLTPKDFNVLNLLTVKAVGGVGGNIVAEGDLSVSGYTGLAGDLDVTGDTDITGDLDVVGNVTVAVDATVSGALAVSGKVNAYGDMDVTGEGWFYDEVTFEASIHGKDADLSGDLSVGDDLTVTGDATVGGTLGVTGAATFGDNVTLAAGKTLTASELDTRGIILSDGIQGHEPVSIYGANDEIELIGDNDGPVSLTNVKDISASGDLYGTELNLTNANNKSVQIEVAAENTVYFNGTSDAPVVIGNVDTPTANGHAANKSYVDSAVSGKANASQPSLSGTITITDTNNASVYVANTGDVLVLSGHNHSDAVEIGNVATPTYGTSAANKSYVDGVAGVTAANVAAAIGNMTAAQAAQAVEDLGAAPAEIVSTVSGATPTITPVAGTTYKCGELTSLTISNPPATGAWSVVFTSGSTATTTTIPSTILGLESFAAAANTIYEINVLDNRAVVGSWAVSV